jgi:hypothetical protein
LTSDFHYRKQFKSEETGVFTFIFEGEGEILSVYSKAVNILSQSGLILSLVENESQMTSLGVRIPVLFQNSEAWRLKAKPGKKVLFEGGQLILENLHIDIGAGKPWHGVLMAGDVMGFRFSKIPILRTALIRSGRQGGLLGLIHPEKAENPFLRKVSYLLTQLSTKRHDLPMIKGLSQVVGLGIGLTPSGDDFIAGVLLGERIVSLAAAFRRKASHMTENRMTPLSIDKEEIWDVLDGTTSAGRTLLWQALQGYFPSYMIKRAKALAAARNDREVLEQVCMTLSHGKTSGTDSLVGLFVYLNWAAKGSLELPRSGEHGEAFG